MNKNILLVSFFSILLFMGISGATSSGTGNYIIETGNILINGTTHTLTSVFNTSISVNSNGIISFNNQSLNDFGLANYSIIGGNYIRAEGSLYNLSSYSNFNFSLNGTETAVNSNAINNCKNSNYCLFFKNDNIMELGNSSSPTIFNYEINNQSNINSLIASLSNTIISKNSEITNDSNTILTDKGIISNYSTMISTDNGIISKDNSTIKLKNQTIASENKTIDNDNGIIIKDNNTIKLDSNTIATDNLTITNLDKPIIKNITLTPTTTQIFNRTTIRNVTFDVRVNRIPYLHINKTIIPSWIKSQSYINSTYGINILVPIIAKLNLNKTLAPAQIYSNSIYGINIKASPITANSINNSDLINYYNSKATDCVSYINFTSNGTKYSLCARSKGQDNYSIADICTGLTKYTNLSSGLAQCVGEFAQLSNASAQNWHNQYEATEKELQNKTLILQAVESGANESSAYNNFLVEAMSGVIVVIILFMLYDIRKRSMRINTVRRPIEKE